jgi:precorrin-3B synthase
MSAPAPRREDWRPSAPERKGWCPGALRPMETGDGLLARVRPSGGRLSLNQALTLANAAMSCGNGAISFSARGNLHLRGLSERTLPDLHARLHAAGLLDSDPEVERLRNIAVSPLHDIDPEAAFDLAPALHALEARLAGDEALRPLPAKFSFALDALGRLPIGGIEADIRFEAARSGANTVFAVFLAGEDGLAAICAEAEVGDVAARLALAFLVLAGEHAGAARRMRSLVERVGAKPVFAEAGFKTIPRARSQRGALMTDLLGAHAFGAKMAIGAAAAFGAIEAESFAELIESARSAGASEFRLAPWRVFLVTGVEAARAASFTAAAARLGFILSADDPRLRVVACPGAPACANAHRPLREDATRWAALLPKGEGVVLHVSGCAKGCARPTATAATLTATAAGYDLILAGRAADEPARRGLSSGGVDEFLLGEVGRALGREGPTA